jgi:hypothetical protein
MRCARSVVAGLLLAGVAGGLGRAADEAETSRAAPEDLSAWEWYQKVELPDNKKSRRVDVILPPAVFARARPDLGDLRLCVGEGQAIPYALRVRRARHEQQVLPARPFNKGYHQDSGTAEVSLDLGEAPGEHNTVVVSMPGKNVRRALRLEGSADGGKWTALLQGVYFVHFVVADHVIDVNRFAYPSSRFRYLRVRVVRDRSLPDDEPKIETVEVLRSVEVPGEDVTHGANVGPREPVRAPGGPGSAWVIDFGGEIVPVERLACDVAEDAFRRTYTVEQLEPGQPARVLVQGEWLRRAGEAARPLEARFPEALARRLRLVVTDHRNPPLTLTGVRYTAPARQVVFVPPGQGQLWLYFGNPHAEAPRYDFAASLPEDIKPAPARGSLGPVATNLAYRPTPKPWTERLPWLMDAVLGAASVVLLGVLGVLGREALRRRAAPPAEAAGTN